MPSGLISTCSGGMGAVSSAAASFGNGAVAIPSNPDTYCGGGASMPGGCGCAGTIAVVFPSVGSVLISVSFRAGDQLGHGLAGDLPGGLPLPFVDVGHVHVDPHLWRERGGGRGRRRWVVHLADSLSWQRGHMSNSSTPENSDRQP